MKRIVQHQDEAEIISVQEARKDKVICYNDLNMLGLVVHEFDEGLKTVFIQWCNGDKSDPHKTFQQLFEHAKYKIKFYQL